MVSSRAAWEPIQAPRSRMARSVSSSRVASAASDARTSKSASSSSLSRSSSGVDDGRGSRSGSVGGEPDRVCLSYTHDRDFERLRRKLGDATGNAPPE